MRMVGSVVFLPVKDLARTRAFYTQVIGLRLAMVQPAGAEIYDTGYGYWGFCGYGGGRPGVGGGNGGCRSIHCEDGEEVEARWRKAVALGAQAVSPPAEHARFPVYSCFVEDPDGYRVEFQVDGR